MKKLRTDIFLLVLMSGTIIFMAKRIRSDSNTIESLKSDTYTQDIIKIQLSNSKLIDISHINIRDKFGLEHRFRDITGTTTKLIFYFSQKDCSECYVTELNNLRSFSSAIGKENIIILVDFTNFRGLNSIFKSYEFNYYILSPTNLLFNRLSEINQPYYLMVNKTMAFNVFIPEKSIPTLSRQYISGYINIVKGETHGKPTM
jgi:hypothetical protein